MTGIEEILALPLLPRSILPKLLDSLKRDYVVVLAGPRQSGKTRALYLLLQAAHSEGTSSANMFYFDLEDEDVLIILNSGVRPFLDYLKGLGADLHLMNLVFIDEIQYLRNPSSFLKLLHDHNPGIKLVVSGSSTLEIKKKFKDSMAGRKSVYGLLPLSFPEFLNFRGRAELTRAVSGCPLSAVMAGECLAVCKKTAPFSKELCRLFEEFVVWGGYPKATLESNIAARREYINDIHTSYVRKDIKDIARIDNVDGFNRLVKLLALQTGSQANLSELCLSARLARETLERYLFLLENTFIIQSLKPYFTNQRKELVKMPKFYFMDTGLRNVIATGFQSLDARSDAGALVENAMLNQWMRTGPFYQPDEIRYWRTQAGAEVDFIFPLDDGEVLPVEVKWQRLKTVSVPSGMRSFIEAYKPRNALILTKGLSGKTEVKGTSVHFLPVWLFCGNAGL